MDCPELKNLMRTYLGDVVDSEELKHLFVVDPYCPHLHMCIMLTGKYPNLNDYLKEYLETYGNVDQVDYNGWSALHIASLNSGKFSSERTVEILINANANVNLQDNYGWTALHDALCSTITSTERTVEILILADADVFNIKDKNNKTPYDRLPQELIERFGIDEATQTICIKTGKLTKCAKK